MSKAITLPVNILVIVAIAVIVLMGLIAIYGVGFNPFSSAINLESMKNVACRKISFSACKINAADITVNFDANKDGATDSSDTFLELCKNFFGRSDELSCKQLCGCTGTTVSSGGGGPGPGPGPGPGCTCNWALTVPPIACFIVGGGMGCFEDCKCSTNGCGQANNIRCADGATLFPEGTTNHCLVGAVGC